jgi:hypothetical protein
MGVWQSEKIARIQPEWMRPEYANWIPLALANGSFEADTRRIWSTVYSYNRPDVSLNDADEIKREFFRVGLLFLWPDDLSGKTWGYFVGIEKPGRLPAKSRLDKRHEPVGPTPPTESLRSYVELTRSKAIEPATASQWLANGYLGFGFGLGSGSGTGTGTGKPLSPKASSASAGIGAATNSRRQRPAPVDVRHKPFFDFSFEAVRLKKGQPPTWSGKEGKSLSMWLKQHPGITEGEWRKRFGNYISSTDEFVVKQGLSLCFFLSRFDSFLDGPVTGGKPDASTIETRNLAAAGFRTN